MIDPAVSEKMFEHCERWADDGRTPDHGYIISSPIGEDIISNDFDLAERFNDYFINVAANLKAPIEQSNFDDLREHIRLTIPDNVVFELPEIDENFVFK